MLDGEIKQKNLEFIKSLVKKPIKKKEMSIDNINEEDDNLDHLMRRTIYNQDLVLYSRAMIKKKKYF